MDDLEYLRWGFLLALLASVPHCYTAVLFYVWDRDLGFRQRMATYWVLIWGLWPVFSLVESSYCLVRLME